MTSPMDHGTTVLWHTVRLVPRCMRASDWLSTKSCLYLVHERPPSSLVVRTYEVCGLQIWITTENPYMPAQWLNFLLWSQPLFGLNPQTPLISCVTLGKLPKLSESFHMCRVLSCPKLPRIAQNYASCSDVITDKASFYSPKNSSLDDKLCDHSTHVPSPLFQGCCSAEMH